MKDVRFSEIACPLCKRVFRAKGGKSRTLKQWEISLFIHLIVAPNHFLSAKEARSVVDSYSEKMGSETPGSKQTKLP
jgi:hypothetical protein